MARDPRFRYLEQKNSGLSDARNRELACGDQPQLPPSIEIRPTALTLLGVAESGGLDYSTTEVERLRREPWVQRLEFDVPVGAKVHPFINVRHRWQ